MTIVDNLGSSIGSFAWGQLGNALFIFIIFFTVLIVVGFVSFFMWWKSFNVKVHVYRPLGQVKFTDLEMQEIQEAVNRGEISPLMKNIKFDYMVKRTTHGKDTTSRGTAYFSLFMPLKKIKPVPLQFRFHDGVHLVQLSKDIFIPVPRPSFVISVAQNVSISVAEQQEWISWSNLMADRINAKYQDPDHEKKQILYFVIGIAAMVIIGGLLLWLIYQSAKKGMDVKNFAESFAQSVKGMVPAGTAPK